jgi:hypothetical protein
MSHVAAMSGDLTPQTIPLDSPRLRSRMPVKRRCARFRVRVLAALRLAAAIRIRV